MVVAYPLLQLFATLATAGSVSAAPTKSSAPNAVLPFDIPFGLPTEPLVNYTIAPQAHRRDDGDPEHNNNRTPEKFFTFTLGRKSFFVGQRGAAQNYKPTELCTITSGDLKKGMYLSCVRWTKRLTFDVRRFGARPHNCDGTKEATSVRVLDSERNTFGVSMASSVSFGPLSASMGFSSEKETFHEEEKSLEVVCGEGFNGKSCNVGGRALVEMNMMEGWVPQITGWVPDSSHPLGMSPQWDNMDDESKNFGLNDMVTGSRFVANTAQYPEGWDSWAAKDNACYVNGRTYYQLNIDGKQ